MLLGRREPSHQTILARNRSAPVGRLASLPAAPRLGLTKPKSLSLDPRPIVLVHVQAFHGLAGDLSDEIEVLIEVQHG